MQLIKDIRITFVRNTAAHAIKLSYGLHVTVLHRCPSSNFVFRN